MMILILLILCAIAVLVWSLQETGRGADRFRQRSPAILGFLLVFSGFFMMGWIRFEPLDFVLNILGDMVGMRAIELLWGPLSMVSELLAVGQDSWFLRFGIIPGWLLIFALPPGLIGLRLLLISIGLFAVVNVVWVPLSIILSIQQVRGINLFLGMVALLQAIAIFMLLPIIDSWGAPRTVWPAFIALVLGMQMGNGVWTTWIGLLLLAANHFVDGQDVPSVSNGEAGASASYTLPSSWS